MLRCISIFLLFYCELSYAVPSANYENVSIEKDLRQFILFHHRNLGNDVIEGKGDFLNNLYSYFYEEGLEPPSLLTLKQQLEKIQDTPKFANSIISIYTLAVKNKISKKQLKHIKK